MQAVQPVICADTLLVVAQASGSHLQLCLYASAVIHAATYIQCMVKNGTDIYNQASYIWCQQTERSNPRPKPSCLSICVHTGEQSELLIVYVDLAPANATQATRDPYAIGRDSYNAGHTRICYIPYRFWTAWHCYIVHIYNKRIFNVSTNIISVQLYYFSLSTSLPIYFHPSCNSCCFSFSFVLLSISALAITQRCKYHCCLRILVKAPVGCWNI